MKELITKWADLFGITEVAVATITVTVIIFLSGLVFNNLITGIYAFNKRKTHRILSILNHRSLIADVARQSRCYKHLYDQIKIEREGAFHIKYQLMPALSAYKEIGYENLYKAYFNGIENIGFFNTTKKVRAFNSLWKNIERISNTHSSSIERSEKMVDYYAKLNEIRNESLGKAQANIENFRIRFHRILEIKEPLGAFYEKREKIIQTFLKNKNPQLAHTTEKYVQDLLTLNRENVDLIQRYESDIKSVELNSYLLDASLRFINMKNYLETNYGIFEHLEAQYYESYLSLIKSYRTLNPRGFRIGKLYSFIKKLSIEGLKNKLIDII